MQTDRTAANRSVSEQHSQSPPPTAAANGQHDNLVDNDNDVVDYSIVRRNTAAAAQRPIFDNDHKSASELGGYGADNRCRRSSGGWSIRATNFAHETINPIRRIIEELKIEPNPDKFMIPLSIGDPTTFGNLNAAPETVRAVRACLDTGAGNGYGHSTGLLAARQAVADYVRPHHGNASVAPNDVILCSGCSSSLDLCIAVLAGPGQNILIPRPGFSIYRTLALGHGVEVRSYDLLPEHNWEADLEQMERLIDDRTAALVLTNPSNPCGSVFGRQHLERIVRLAERHFVPIIADEIYEHFVFPGVECVAVSALARTVPVLSCGGLTKRFLVPGWRLGWIVVHDPAGVMADVRKGLESLSTRILGANMLVQSALPAILRDTPQSFFDGVVATLYKHATLAFSLLSRVPGLRPIRPDGAMYMMIGIDVNGFDGLNDELQFVQALVREQSVFCLPGSCFDYPNYIRIVLTVPEEMVIEACARMAEFCVAHYRRPTTAVLDVDNGLSAPVDGDAHFGDGSGAVNDDEVDDDDDDIQQHPDVTNGNGCGQLNELKPLNAMEC